MCFHPFEKVYPPSVHDRLLGINSPRSLQLPCGKCADCLRKRQNDLQVRCYNEAKIRGSAVFVTLTYNPSCVPVARSLWFADKETGELECYDKPELVCNTQRVKGVYTDSPDSILRGKFVVYSRTNEGAPMLYENVPFFSELTGQDWFIQYTPTLYYEDVKLALKRFRKNNPDLPKFTYVCCGEYGANPHSTQRPHYHLVFFGLQLRQALKFCNEWKYGFYNCKQVKFVNEDGSDGLSRVARYIGKYCAKGVVDIYNPNKGCVLSNRLRSSKGLGTELPEHILNHFLAKDICNYDINDPYKTIPSDLLDKVVSTIADRLYFKIGNYNYGIPQNLKRKLFAYQRRDSAKYERPTGFTGKNLCIEEKAHYAPVWYLVANELQRRAIENNDSEFRQLLSDFHGTDIRPAVDRLNDYKENIEQYREASLQNSLLNFYQQHTKV